jgi:hypothetical protein
MSIRFHQLALNVSQEEQFFCRITYTTRATFLALSLECTTSAENRSKPDLVIKRQSEITRVCHREKVQLIGLWHWSDDQLACENSLAVKGKISELELLERAEYASWRWSAKQQMWITRGEHALALQQPPHHVLFLLLVARSLT